MDFHEKVAITLMTIFIILGIGYHVLAEMPVDEIVDHDQVMDIVQTLHDMMRSRS